jgi:alpha-N-acetylglucosaminidase
MKYKNIAKVLGIMLCLFLMQRALAVPVNPVNDIVKRVVPRYQGRIVFEKILPADVMDVFEIESINNTILIRGNNFSAMAVGLNHYLKYYCQVDVSWYSTDKVNYPEVMPLVVKKVRRLARVKNRFFLNYCTFGYTMPWWQWKDWERLIDWMALNGINTPLAITGQEAVWYNVWKKFGLSDEEIRGYFTGPAHLPWHRMSNLDHWQGPLPMSWIKNQEALQKKILERERSFGMKPVLPAFAGHVPQALLRKYPKAKITKLSEWGGFTDQYRSSFLDPFDSLFTEIQRTFLKEQTAIFGTDHIYGADPFNEVKPPSWEPDYLAKVSKNIYEGINAIDPDATWLMMTWIYYFEKEHWTKPRIASFLKAVPQDKMMLLDYYCEKTEVWKMTDSYFNQPFIWCYLGNFGGNTMLAGNIDEVEKRMENAFANNPKNLWGIGSTLEGFDVNPMMYEYVFEKAWGNDTTDTKAWIKNWANRRTGLKDANTEKAWELLHERIYNQPAELGQGTLTNARPTLTGNGNWTTNNLINYNNKDLFTVWELLLKSKNTNNSAYRYDVVNIGRQVLGNYFTQLRDDFTADYKTKNLTSLKLRGKSMIEILDDIDFLLSTQSSFLLGKWLSDAEKMAATAVERKYYEENARNIITTWGTKAQSLNDYGNRTWAGLTKTYYRKRWEMFIHEVISSVEKNKDFDEKTFLEKVTQFELDWTKQNQVFNDQPEGDSFKISKALALKYKNRILNH